MRPNILCLLLLAILAGVGIGPAYAANSEFRAFEAGEPVTIRPDRAYILIRAQRGSIFVRVPTAQEQAHYRALKLVALAKMGKKAPAYADFAFDPGTVRNIHNLWNKKPYEEVSPLPIPPVQLIETVPGDYILYGVGGPNAYILCFCLGTVGFSAKAGEITDVGTFFTDRADRLSILPELASETNIGPTAAGDFPLTAGALRPYRTGDRIPPALLSLPRHEARFHAVGPYVDRRARNINRLAAIPGVLAYDLGQVIDVRSGKIAPPR